MSNLNTENIINLMKEIISKDEFLSIEKLDENEIRQSVYKELVIAINEEDEIRVDELIYLVFHFNLLIQQMDKILIYLLGCDWHKQHENIAMLLQRSKPPSSIDVLYETAIKEYKYLEYDEAYALAVKCIWALGDIGTEYAKQKLQLLLNSDVTIIKENAQKQLNRLKEIKKNIRNTRMSYKEIRAVYSDDSIRIYQAYSKMIADEALLNGKFGNRFNLNRMTWIKPSFLWMMYRCGWAEKEGQERVLAIDIKRSAFDYLVKNAVPSSYDESLGITWEEWKKAVKNSDIRCQWDPERDINGNALEYRSLQIGIRGNAIYNYVNDWILDMTDITEFVYELNVMRKKGCDIQSFLPKEKIYKFS